MRLLDDNKACEVPIFLVIDASRHDVGLFAYLLLLYVLRFGEKTLPTYACLLVFYTSFLAPWFTNIFGFGVT
jgi:hypothetical protein